MNKWLISSQKNKSNVRGIKIKDVSRLIALLISLKGNAYDQKMDNLKRVYSTRHLLLKMKSKRLNRRSLRRYQNKVLERLKRKYGDLSLKKPEIETLQTSIPKLVDLIIFLKYKRKYKKIRTMIRFFRANILVHWYKKPELEKRWLLVWKWINNFIHFSKVHKYNFKIDIKKFREVKPKYKWVCKDIKKRTA